MSRAVNPMSPATVATLVVPRKVQPVAAVVVRLAMPVINPMRLEWHIVHPLINGLRLEPPDVAEARPTLPAVAGTISRESGKSDLRFEI